MDHAVSVITAFTVYSLSDSICEKEWLWYFHWMCIPHIPKLGNIAVVWTDKHQGLKCTGIRIWHAPDWVRQTATQNGFIIFFSLWRIILYLTEFAIYSNIVTFIALRFVVADWLQLWCTANIPIRWHWCNGSEVIWCFHVCRRWWKKKPKRKCNLGLRKVEF